ncbi:MAG TPA: DUF6206 family protein [Smithella sp.]|nr:DUF6206 family protein [Smithella sp.]
MLDKIDRGLLQKFEYGLNPQSPEGSAIPALIIGYGEMSTIFAINVPGQESLAYKRLPIFRTMDEMQSYEKLFQEYNSRLGEIGLNIPAFAVVRVAPRAGNMVIYNVQARLDARSIGNRLIHTLPKEGVMTLFGLTLAELNRVFTFNESGTGVKFGIDGQISNWAAADYKEGFTIGPDTKLCYIDTSTPLMHIGGIEQLNPELFLRSAPSFLLWIIRWLFLKDVMTRYYDFRKVVIDLIANFYKEQLPELIPALINAANDFFANEGKKFNIAPITGKEVLAYYREDAMIWRAYLALRKMDRFLHLRVLRKPYVYILPGKIKR